MNDEVDPFLEYDAAYVMGALSPEDQQAFEAHLDDCPDCVQAVAELSGMPRLLDRVPVDRVLQPEAEREPPPDLLLPNLIKAARAERRRRSMWLVASGAVAATVVAAAVVVGLRTGPAQPTGETVAMSEVRPAAVTGTLRVTPASWGTRVSLVCRWVGATTPADAGVKKTYRLVAVPRDGSDERVLAQWSVLPGDDATVVGSTDLATAGIARIELRAVADDAVLLEATPERFAAS